MISKEEKDRIERKAHEAISDISTPGIYQNIRNGNIYNIIQSSEGGDIINDCKAEIIKLEAEIQFLKKQSVDKDLIFVQHNEDSLELIKAKDDQIAALKEMIESLKKIGNT